MSVGATSLLLGGYLLSLTGLNVLCYLISQFYQQKFQESSPRTGFLIGAIFGVLAAASLLVPQPSGQTFRIVQVVVVCGAGIVSAINAVSLYYTMKRIRK